LRAEAELAAVARLHRDETDLENATASGRAPGRVGQHAMGRVDRLVLVCQGAV
jgi:hypothetical protein